MQKLCLRKALYVCCSLQALMNLSAQATFDLGDFDMEKHRTHYNSLPAIEESDELLKKSTQFKPFLKEAGKIVTHYELEGSIGLRLIHRHFDLGENQVMAEKFKTVNKTPSLVTTVQDIDKAKKAKALPSSWIFPSKGDENVQLFEASTDPVVRLTHQALKKSPKFFTEMGDLLRKYQLNHLLSVAVLKRETLVAKKGQIYLEGSSFENKESVVQICHKDKQPKLTIQTSWSIKGPKQQRCQAVTVCQMSSDYKNPGHTGNQTVIHF